MATVASGLAAISACSAGKVAGSRLWGGIYARLIGRRSGFTPDILAVRTSNVSGVEPDLRKASRLVPLALDDQRCLMRFSSVLTACCALALLLVHTSAAEIEFIRVWPGWRDATAFESISEYFTGQEAHSGRVVLRTNADQRAGYYYLVRVANSGAAQSAVKFSLQVITPASADTKTYSFPATLGTGQTVFELGLTGPDWPDAKLRPVAWKLELLGSDGAVLATAKSFLWEKPER